MLVIKLLTLLGSISIVAPTASVAIACTDKVPTATSNNNSHSDNSNENDDMDEGSRGTEIKTEQPKEDEKSRKLKDINNGSENLKTTEESSQIEANSERPQESETVTTPSESGSSTQGNTTSSEGRGINNLVSSNTSSWNIDDLDMEEHNTVQ
ncbi:lipoprotein [Mycoplasma mycoides subsp. capri]|uniref:lipoprotein n=1 Tax=Mycoplasma mycoides TaxID=2102 RepID=UPI00223EBAEE|nr:lipoprotein [Mycoplasma mycoides]UZK63954.1 lipoprotein [Mycoplasma mycoides subsp. capri]